MGHPKELASQNEGADVRADPGGREFLKRPFQRFGKNGGAAKIFRQEPGKLGIGPKRGEDIDKAKQLNLKVLIPHAPVQEQVIPPSLIENMRGAGFGVISQRSPDALDGRFQQLFSVHVHLL